MNLAVLLADFALQDILRAWRNSGDARFEAIVIIGSLTLVSGLAALAVMLFHGRRRRRRRHRESVPRIESQSRHRRHHHRHTDSGPRNPTLAETGGLPPRHDQPPPA